MVNYVMINTFIESVTLLLDFRLIQLHVNLLVVYVSYTHAALGLSKYASHTTIQVQEIERGRKPEAENSYEIH